MLLLELYNTRYEQQLHKGAVDQSHELAEGLGDLARRVGSRVLDRLAGYDSDQQLIKDLQSRVGVPATGRRPEPQAANKKPVGMSENTAPTPGLQPDGKYYNKAGRLIGTWDGRTFTVDPAAKQYWIDEFGQEEAAGMAIKWQERLKKETAPSEDSIKYHANELEKSDVQAGRPRQTRQQYYDLAVQMLSGRPGMSENSEEPVGFHVDTELAYQAVMRKFGNVVSQDPESGTMYVPAQLWTRVEQVAFDADGRGAEREEGVTEGVAESQFDVSEYGDTPKEIFQNIKNIIDRIALPNTEPEQVLNNVFTKWAGVDKFGDIIRNPDGTVNDRAYREAYREAHALANLGSQISDHWNIRMLSQNPEVWPRANAIYELSVKWFQLYKQLAKKYKNLQQGVAEGSSNTDVKKQISKFEELALAANRAGDDAKCKQYQQKIQALKQKMSQGVAEGWKGELAGGTIGGIAGNLAGSALVGPLGGIVGGAVGGAGGGIIGRELTKEEQLNEFAPILAAGARLVIAMAPKISQVLKSTGKATVKAAAPVAKSGAEITAKNAGQIGLGLGAYEIGSSVADIAKDITAKVGTALEEKTVMELAQVAFKFAIPAGIVLAILYGGKKVIDSLFSNSNQQQGVAEGSNDYFKRRKDEEDRIAGTKPPAKRIPRQTDYEKKRKQQGVAEGGAKDRQWSNKDMERLRVATRDFDDIMASDGPEATKQNLIKKRIKTKPMAGPKGVLPEQGVAEENIFSLTEKTAVKQAIAAAAKKVAGLLGGPSDEQLLQRLERETGGRRPAKAPAPTAHTVKEDSSTGSAAAEQAIMSRIMTAHIDLLRQFGPDKVMQAAEEVAYGVGDVDEIGTSDVSAYVRQVRQILGAE